MCDDRDERKGGERQGRGKEEGELQRSRRVWADQASFPGLSCPGSEWRGAAKKAFLEQARFTLDPSLTASLRPVGCLLLARSPSPAEEQQEGPHMN